MHSIKPAVRLVTLLGHGGAQSITLTALNPLQKQPQRKGICDTLTLSANMGSLFKSVNWNVSGKEDWSHQAALGCG